MKNLSTATIRKMRAVIDSVLLEPKLYDQDRIPYGDLPCDTPCCAAGWVIWNHNPNPKAYSRTLEEVGPINGAAKALGMDVTLFSHLFTAARNWPYEFADKYQNAKTHRGRAQAMAAYWEHFIKVDGKI